MVLYGRLGVHWFNFEHNRNLKFIRIPKLNTGHPNAVSFYITVEVEDVDAAAAGASSPSSLTLQTLVSRLFFPLLDCMIQRCRIKPTTAIAEEPYLFFDHFRYDGVDAFYKGPMPTFLSGPPEEAADDQRFYVVPYEVIDQNDWLLLYAHFALFKVCEAESHSFLPEEMHLKKILMQTQVKPQDDDDDDDDDDEPMQTQVKPQDDDDEPMSSPILKSMNAIFHISFSVNCRDYTTVVRRTTDGLPGHMRLEVEVEPAKKHGD
ncbi:PREDICTED: UPF0725 protein At3g44770 [Camelina sativa]|uniref:UPF0725 protein At3g44770 n=1 Tax=Camelina sativa TaxID=90675 RepID=A0ABM0VZF4_CAMSA|nr:PREDICTED: UPF0725 protein At3g44770 [Camelina sativa]